MKRLCTLLAMMLMLCIGANAQQDNGELIDVLRYLKHTMLFSESYPQEKVYLHFDNTGYFKGETIWFKGYVVKADTGKPTDLSRVLYVELVAPTGDVIETRKLPIEHGEAYGDIKLDSVYTTGFYEVRAYTRYMTNWGNTGIFSRVFPVFKHPKTEGDYSKMLIDEYGYRNRLPDIRVADIDSTKISDRRIVVNFYPEGGDLVKGLKSRVAFVVSDNSGSTMSTGGLLLDAKKQVLSAVATSNDGRGIFEITPDGQQYYLRLSDAKGRQHDFPLPAAKEDGIVINVNTLLEDLYVKIAVSPSYEGRIVGYALMHNGRVVKADTIIAEPLQAIEFDRRMLPAGVNQLTFFTSEGRIQADRLFFICPQAYATDSISVTSPNAFPKPCGKVNLNIKAMPNSSISLSVMDAATMTNGREGNALTWMLLSSEVKGYIADPDYYFESDDREHRQAADLLMMVQGWRRYDWKMMSGIDKESMRNFSQPIEDKLYVYGRLKPKRKKHPVAGVQMDVYLYNTKGNSLHGETVTDSLGNYAFALPDINGDWSMAIKTRKEDKDVNYIVCIDRHFSPDPRVIMPIETQTVEQLKGNLFVGDASKKAAEEANVYVPIQKRDHVLPTVVVKAKRRIYDNARASWETERNGQKWATLHYNPVRDADKYIDQGMPIPTVYEWLGDRNPLFGASGREDPKVHSSTENTIKQKLEADSKADLGHAVNGEMNGTSSNELAAVSKLSSDSYSIFEDGLSYHGRPIVWILNNNFKQITNMPTDIGDMFSVFRMSSEDMPIFMDELKSAWISENPLAWKTYLQSDDLLAYNPLTIFLYTFHTFPPKVKGLRNTYFSGYNEPSTFEMDDYTTLPPMEDFRRTIYWNPNVKTDAQGNAKVEFFNNSTCHEMHVSAEGFTSEGKFLVNE